MLASHASLNPFCGHVRSVLMQSEADGPARAVGFEGDLGINDFKA